jgi:hypothetical protein
VTHALPQPPQFAGLLMVSAQPLAPQQTSLPLQVPAAAPLPHTQRSLPQLSGGAQVVPQLPQCVSDDAKHAPPQHKGSAGVQLVAPHGQLAAQVDTPPEVQQSCCSVQVVLPHAHFPPAQVSPGAQTLPQAPQLLVSVVTSTQPAPLQQALPATQAEPLRQVHAPFVHASPETPQLVPQPPQFFASAVTAMQAPPQQASPSAQIVLPQRASAMASATSPSVPKVATLVGERPMVFDEASTARACSWSFGVPPTGGSKVKTKVGLKT